MRLLIILLFLSSCSYLPVDRDLVLYRTSYIEREFIPAVELFEKECNKKVDLDIRFIPTIPGKAIGVCIGLWMPSFIPRTIYVEEDWWRRWSHVGDMGEELILHELGHCVLDRGHIEDKYAPDDRPHSIMYPSIFGYWGWYEASKKEYLKELCENS